jgi:hypothetical protein
MVDWLIHLPTQCLLLGRYFANSCVLAMWRTDRYFANIYIEIDSRWEGETSCYTIYDTSIE